MSATVPYVQIKQLTHFIADSAVLNVNFKLNFSDNRSTTDSEHFISAPGRLERRTFYEFRHLSVNSPELHVSRCRRLGGNSGELTDK